MAAHGTDEGMMEWTPTGLSGLPGCFTQFLYDASDFRSGCLCRQGRPKGNRDGERDLFRQFGKKSPANKTEYAAPYPIQMDRNNRGFPALENSLKPGAKRKKASGPRNLAFREDAHKVPFIKAPASFPKRLENFPRGSRRRNRNGTHNPCHTVEDGIIVIVPIHQKANWPIHAGEKQQTIDEGHMVGDKQRPFLQGDMVPTNDLEPVNSIGQQDKDHTHKPLGEHPPCPHSDERSGEARSHQDATGTQSKVRKHSRAQRPSQHTTEYECITEGNDRSSMISR